MQAISSDVRDAEKRSCLKFQDFIRKLSSFYLTEYILNREILIILLLQYELNKRILVTYNSSCCRVFSDYDYLKLQTFS